MDHQTHAKVYHNTRHLRSFNKRCQGLKLRPSLCQQMLCPTEVALSIPGILTPQWWASWSPSAVACLRMWVPSSASLILQVGWPQHCLKTEPTIHVQSRRKSLVKVVLRLSLCSHFLCLKASPEQGPLWNLKEHLLCYEPAWPFSSFDEVPVG